MNFLYISKIPVVQCCRHCNSCYKSHHQQGFLRLNSFANLYSLFFTIQTQVTLRTAIYEIKIWTDLAATILVGSCMTQIDHIAASAQIIGKLLCSNTISEIGVLLISRDRRRIDFLILNSRLYRMRIRRD